MLTPFGDEIWIADGPAVSIAGFHYPTGMVVIRLRSGGLFVCSPIPLTDEQRAGIDALGDVAHLVAPNSVHHLFLSEWKAAYPRTRLHAPPRLRDKRKDIAFDADLGDAPDPAWDGEIDQVLVPGNLITTEVVFFHVGSRTILFTDLIQHIPQHYFSGWRAWVARLDLMVAPEPSVPRKFRVAFVGRGAARASLARILAWPASHLLMAHGAPVIGAGRRRLCQSETISGEFDPSCRVLSNSSQNVQIDLKPPRG